MKIGILCDLCGDHAVGGQVTKTKELIRYFTEQGDETDICDVYGIGRRHFIQLFRKLKKFCKKNKKIIIILGRHNYTYIIVLLILLKKIYHNFLFDVVIGGERYQYLRCGSMVYRCCKKVEVIYVETQKQQKEYEKLGLYNVVKMPSFQRVIKTKIKKFDRREDSILPVCTLSRVCPEKGIGTAVKAVLKANQQIGHKAFALNIYGPVEKGYKEEFEKIMEQSDSLVSYQGTLIGEEIRNTLKNHYLLLFPSFHKGEGFPTTIIDAYSAGLPVISTDINALQEIVRNGETGFIVSRENAVEAIAECLVTAYQKPDFISKMKIAVQKEAEKYDVRVVLSKLRSDILRIGEL